MLLPWRLRYLPLCASTELELSRWLKQGMSRRSLWWPAGSAMALVSTAASGNPQLVGFGSVPRSHGSGRSLLLLQSSCPGAWPPPSPLS